MKLTKQITAELATAYKCALEVSITNMNAPLRYINKYIAENVSGYGTAADEKIQSREEYRNMAIAARKQSKGMLFKAKITTPYRPKFIDNTTAQFRDEIIVQVGDKKNINTLHLRFSTLFKYQFGTWQMTMFHGSMPDAGSSIDDTFHVGEAEKKLKELEQVVAQRTAALQTKTRELEIESSLERVRTVTMGMNTSGDILNICKVFFTELQTLGFKDLRNALINFWDDENGVLHDYDYSDFSGGNFAKLAYSSHPAFEQFQKKIRKAKDAFAKLVIKKDGLKSWQQRRRSSGEYKDLRLNKISALYYYFYSTGVGALGISTFSPISKDEVELLKKFRNVFDLAYKRYQDIQKAEAQAREAQIEAALERVRSRAMAMHVSKELKEVAKEMRNQFSLLGQKELETCAIHLWDQSSGQLEAWAALRNTDNTGDIIESETRFDIKGIRILEEAFQNYIADKKDYLIISDAARAKEFFKAIKKVDAKAYHFLTNRTKHIKSNGITAYWSVSDFRGGSLVMVTVNPPDENSRTLLQRFANVFGQAFQRFKDLQKAEAQAREAQIEAALEKVRSRSLAMHKSDELKEVIRVVLEQFVHLKINAEHAGFYIDYKAHDDMHIWLADPNIEPFFITLPYFDTPTWNSFIKAKAKGTTFHADLLDFKEKNKFYWSLFKIFKIPEEAKKFYLQCKGLAVSTVLLDTVGLYIENFSAIPYTEEENGVLLRFGKVFQQAYTRFLDLKNAEEQTKEAQIEAALERIRSRSMAMQKPSEIGEIIHQLYSELLKLDAQLDRCFIMTVNSLNNGITWWMGGREGLLDNNGFFVQMNQYPSHLMYLENWKNKKKKWEYLLEGKEKRDFDRFIFNKTELARMPEFIRADMSSVKKIHLSGSAEQFGLLVTGSALPLQKEQQEIISRFTVAFNQSYVRYLDIEKAEAQTREAQIELSLERIRAKVTGMKVSADLQDIVVTMRHEFVALGHEAHYFWHMKWLPDRYEKAMTSGDGTRIGNVMELPRRMHGEIPALAAWEKSKAPTVVFVMNVEETFDYVHKMIEWGSFKQIDPNMPSEDDIRHIGGLTYVMARTHHGEIGYSLPGMVPNPPTDDVNTLVRFAAVFDLAYRRFEDLKSSEIQIREAQIELALERVRARSMAMYKSEELADLSSVLVKQVQALGVATWFCAFNIYNENDSVEWGSNGEGTYEKYITPRENVFLRYYEAGQRGETLLINKIGKDECPAHYDYLCTVPGLGEQLLQMKAAGIAFPVSQIDHVAYFKYGYLLFISYEPVPGSHEIFKRFANVFEQSYTRFLDLQKAEAQTRESQIQLALERVRAKTMAMQHSDELLDAATLMFQQMEFLGTSTWNCSFNIWTEDKKQAVAWNATREGFGRPFYSPSSEDVFFEFFTAAQQGNDFFVKDIGGKELEDHYKYLSTLPGVGNTIAEFKAAGIAFPNYQVFNIAYFAQGYLMFITYEPVPEFEEIFKRFAKTFEQTYTRFLDLQKAEAQAKESKIEVALEKVRSRSLAMHKSDELEEVIMVVSEQLQSLDFRFHNASFVRYNEKNGLNFWLSSPGQPQPYLLQVPYLDNPVFNRPLEAIEKGIDFIADIIAPKDNHEWLKHLLETSVLKNAAEKDKNDLLHTAGYARSLVITKNIILVIGNYASVPYSNEQNAILKRFGNVFEQSYTRFLDLQKAEAQAREAQIQLALERVRARTMAMQKSEELNEVATILFNQLKNLGGNLWTCAIVLCKENSTEDELRTAFENSIQPSVYVPNNADEVHIKMYEGWKNKDEIFSVSKGGEVLKEHYQYMLTVPSIKPVFENMLASGIHFPTWQKWHAAYFSAGYLMIITTEPYTEENIFVRFAKVFEQSYTRFLDLQKAEAQAKEAQIEVALERVRTVALSMKRSEEMLDIAQSLYEQLLELGFANIRNAIIDLHNSSNETFMDYDYSPEMGRTVTQMSYYDHPFIEKQVRQTEASSDAFFELILEGKDLQDLIDVRLKNGEEDDPRLRKIKQLTYNLYSFGNGSIGISNFGLLSEGHKLVLKRFRNVFAFAYQRYADMAQAEEQAREAQIEAALERVRSRTLAMQQSEELSETSAVLFKQLIELGIAPNRLYICIVTNDDGDAEFWITDEDGSKVSMAYKNNLNSNLSFKKMFMGWQQQQKSLVIDMKDDELQQYFKYLSSIHVPFKGGLTQKRRLQYLAYFSKGFIGMASPDEQPEETVQLLERFAGVFNLTFTRFNDLKVAEAHALQAEQDLIEIKAARKKAEEALTELQSTQKQLIQSEKMASLGELTAGIAHEIQNPLNFVNNFSEVNSELIIELVEEVDKGNTDEVKALANDIKDNSEKINQHGKRAGEIVKSMLQHSRRSEDKKEPTDINALCDEYLRLAYHGLRAKDKTFNAKFVTHFDESIPKINVVPQDIGRVILNLINNAFYVVSEKKKQERDGYEPMVIVSTRKEGEKIEVSIRDNGNGIPDAIKEKIFQPFFTTKPTGSGTGLGLSLSYDIVKAHGGEIKVETKEEEARPPAQSDHSGGDYPVGRGTKFTIMLPV